MKKLLATLLFKVGWDTWPAFKGMVMKYPKLASFVFLSVVILMIFFSVGCGSLDFFKERVPDREKTTEWRKDIRFSVNGVMHNGLALVEKSDLYEFKIYPNGDRIDRLILSSCSRLWQCDREGPCDQGEFKKSNWPPWKIKDKYVKFMIRRNDIEQENRCPMRIIALEKKKKENGYGMAVFPRDAEELTISATVHCNGYVERFENGQSVCQSRENLLQKIVFNFPTFFDENIQNKCPGLKLSTKDNKSIEFFMSRGECPVLFKQPYKAKNGKYFSHELTLYGFEALPPPKED